MGYRWKPSASQRRSYAQRMRDIEEVRATTPTNYPILCTGDCCKGDKIAFFNGAKSAGRFYGEIIKESYGEDKQQHTFTILLDTGDKMLIKGRNLYNKGVYRKKWDCEDSRKIAIEEKHNRGDKAREERDIRKSSTEL